MLKRFLKLAVLLLVANALYRVCPVWLHYYEFRDAVHEMALFSHEASDAVVVDKVMALARQYQVPLAREDIRIRREEKRLMVDAAYIELLWVVPNYSYPWQFDIKTSAPQVLAPGGD